MSTFYLDQRIKERFQLYKGVRSQKEDDEIYVKIYEACLAEVFLFVEDNLEEFELRALERELKLIKKSDPDVIYKTYSGIINRLAQVPDGAYKLDRRLDHFINNMLIKSLKKKAGH